MTDLTVLAGELGDDPLSLGLAAVGDADAANLLNAKTRELACDIPLGAFQGKLVSQGRWAGLAQLAATQRPDGDAGTLWDHVVGMRDLIMAGQATVIGVADQSLLTSRLQSLVAAGLISEADKTELLALGLRLGSRAEELGLGLVTPSDIADARRL